MRQKVELIKQIRAVESLPALRANFLDLTETPGYGLLSEMSIIEVSNKLLYAVSGVLLSILIYM